MGDWIRAVIFTAIFVFQVQVLNLVVFEKVSPFETFVYHIDFLGLGPLDVFSC